MSDRHRSPVARPQEGIALIVVLWVVILMTIIAAGFSQLARTETTLAGHQVGRAQGRALARAALSYIAFNMARGDEQKRPPADGTELLWSFGGGTVRFSITDVSGKIDLNKATRELLEGMFLSLGVEDDQMPAILDAIEDWRDEDDLKRLQGAEDEDYEDADLPYGAKDGPFDTVDELQQVLGITPELYRSAKDRLTVFSGLAGIDPASASREVLLSVPDITEEEVDEYLALREEARAAGEPAPAPPPAVSRYLARGSGRAYSVKILAEVDPGVVTQLEATIRAGGAEAQLRSGYSVLEWREDGI